MTRINLRFLFYVEVKRNWMTVLVYETSVSKGTCGFESHPLYKINFPSMIIKVNTDIEINITEKYLTVKDKKLYNTITKKYEGVEGDIVSFNYIKEDGRKSVYKGYVDGYTNGEKVKIRGVNQVFTQTSDKSVEHISSVTSYSDVTDDEKDILIAESA